jgi:CRISPR/Cas system CSM-associated protein Csm3 (group 7 of RAMP superfamily)
MTVERFSGVYEAQTPITHGSDEDFGMEQRFRTIEMAVREDGDLYHEDIPVISGNSLRGQLRDLLAADFLDLISDDDDPVELGDSLSNAFWAGGSLERGNGPGKLNRRMINGIRDNIPMLSLLGTALADQMISGKLNMGMLTPIASETEAFTGRKSDHSVFEFVDETFYTRMDDRVGGKQDDEATQQMRYKMMILIPGTRFDHWMALEGASDVERACLGRAFELFAETPHIGGQKAVGHGKVSFDYADDLPDSQLYLDFVEENRDDIREFVEDLDETVR